MKTRMWLAVVVVACGSVSPAAASGLGRADDPPFQPLPPAQPIPPGGVAAVQTSVLRVVRGAGSVHAAGRIGSAAFSVDLRKGPGQKITYLDARQRVGFHSLVLRSVRFGRAGVTLKGVGLVNGRRERFTVDAVDHGRSGDVFRIAWGGGRSHGGRLVSGGLVVR